MLLSVSCHVHHNIFTPIMSYGRSINITHKPTENMHNTTNIKSLIISASYMKKWIKKQLQEIPLKWDGMLQLRELRYSSKDIGLKYNIAQFFMFHYNVLGYKNAINVKRNKTSQIISFKSNKPLGVRFLSATFL